MATQGIQLPIYLQIQNLQNVTNELKKFAGSNILQDSLGGKKIDAELTKVLHTLAQIELKSKNAFKVESSFDSLEKDINRVELSIEHIQNSIKGLKFEDLKIPNESQEQIKELNAQISALRNNFTSFKAAQKDKLLQNVDFTGSISQAFGKNAGNILEKNYDDMYQAIQKGMNRINSLLIAEKGRFEQNSQILTQNKVGKANYTAWGALEFIQQAFQKVDNANKLSDQQKILQEYMNMNPDTHQFEGWKRGAIGMNGFYKRLADEFKLEPEQLQQIRTNVQEAAKEAGRTALEEWQKIASDQTEAAKIFGNGISFADFKASRDQYIDQMNNVSSSNIRVGDLEGQARAAAAAWKELTTVQQEVAAAQQTLDNALKAPTNSLLELQNSIRGAIVNTPQLGAAFNQAAQEIYTLRQAADAGRIELANLDQTLNKLQGVSNFVNRYVGIYAIVRKVTTAVRNAFNNIKDLDKNITNIAVVTNMSQEDLWGKIGEYTQMAQQFGVATKDVYTVSQLFYQQGLQTNQVMSLTTETLKMAKISGMGYEEAANAMTVAIRAFRIEMTDAQQVTDVYSALAAKFAVSSSEIANAMEKTASSAANVGMSVESTSAFISVMTQTTRESAQNIGSALKSIISRYGEMKASPASLLNIDGEEVAFNKVDTALKSVGISIKDASGQFRDFDDVIMELAQKWDSLDNNTQRYIATVMAGNRQQSRFIALVSNYDELNRAMDTANNAENASIVQVAKTMDSLESKAQQLKNAFSQVYLDLHIEDGLKSAYDILTRIVTTVGKLGTLKGALPTLANIIGLGTGTKTLVNEAKESVLAHRKNIEKRIELNDSEARQKAEELNTMLEKTITKQVMVNVNDSSMVAANTTALMNNTAVSAAMTPELIGFLTRYNPGMTQEQATNTLYNALATKELNDPKAFANKMNIPEEAQNGENGALAALQGLANAAQNATNSLNNVGTSGTNASTGLEQAAQSGVQAGISDETKVSAATSAAQEDYNKALADRNAAQEALNKARADAQAAQAAVEAAENNTLLSASEKERITDAAAQRSLDVEHARSALQDAEANRIAAESALQKAQADDQGAVSEHNEAASSDEAAAADQREAHASDMAAKGGGMRGSGALMKGIGVASGVARLAGTAIAAAGAAHRDKSTDNIELSKLLTGVGNGLSMAGTGASMGMAFGLWGALLGGIAGLLAGGLGAVIDGLTVTLKEKIELQEKEVEAAKDKSLKKQAEATDLSSSISNLQALRKAMYNSTEDMQAYKDAMNTLADQYPNLISTYDEAGNAIIDLNSAEEALAAIRLQGAQAAREASIEEGQLYKKYELAIEEVIEAVKNQKGTTTSSASVGDLTTTTNTGSFILMDESGNKYTYQGNTSRKTTNALGLPGDSFEVNYLDAIKDAMKALDYTQTLEKLTPNDFNEIINELIENPSLGGKHYKEGWRGLQVIPAEFWKAYKNNNIIDNKPKDFVYDVSALDKILKEYSGLLGASSVRELLKLEKEEPIKEEQLNEVIKIVEGVKERNKLALEAINKSSSYALAQENLYSTARNREDLTSSDVIHIQDQGIYSKIYNQMMDMYAKNNNYENSLDWYTKNATNYKETAQIIANSFINWYSDLTTRQKEALEAADFTSFLSVDQLLASAGIKLSDDSEEYKALEKQFIESNSSNRNRILETIYAYDEEGKRIPNTLNEDLKGLSQINSLVEKEEGIEDYSLDIALDIGYGEMIISKYADFFTEQLVNINDLAEQGYTNLAATQLTALHDLYSQLSEIEYSAVQDDLFKIITNIDFSSYDLIINAAKSIEQYGSQQGTDVSNISNALVEASKNLIFNISALASDLTNNITTAAKEIDSILATNKSGLSFDKALEEFNKLSSTFSEINNFNDIFTYDAALGKYIYNAKGLQKAIEMREQQMSTNFEQLSDMSKIYTEQITSITVDEKGNKTYTSNLRQADWTEGRTQYNLKKIASLQENTYKFKNRNKFEQTLDQIGVNIEDIGVQNILDELEKNGSYSLSDFKHSYLTQHQNNQYASKDELMDDIRYIGFNEEQLSNKQLIQSYEELAKGFMEDDNYQLKTLDNFIKYVELKAKENGEQADAAEAILKEYQQNKKNQLYAAIDWSKLALGTDYTGSNKQMLESLGKELGLLIDDLDEKGNVIGQHWVKGYTGSWEGVLNKYFDTVYTDDKAKKAAKAAVKGQIAKSKSDQISTAINEILNGYDSVLSENTLALVQDREDLTIVDGVISTGEDFVKTAIDLYNTYSLSLLSLADKNTAYSSILSKSFEQPTQAITALSSAASMDLSTLGDTFTKFGLELAEFYNAEVGAWQGDLATAVRTDAFGKTHIIDWEKFLQETGINEKLTPEILGSFEYRNAYSSYVDGLITLDTQMLELIHKNYDNAFSSITEWKPINISELVDSQMFKSLATEGIIDADKFKQGQLVIKDAVAYAQNISDWFITLSTQDSSWLYERMGWTPADLAKNWKNAQTVITQVQDVWTNISGGISSLSVDNISTLMEKGGFHLTDLTEEGFTKIGDTYALTLSAYQNYLIEVIGGKGKTFNDLNSNQQKKVKDSYLAAQSAIVNNITGLDWTKVLSQTGTEAEGTEFINNLQRSLASLGIALSSFYIDGKLNVTALKNTLQEKAKLGEIDTEVAEQVVNHLATTIATVRDTAFNEISTGFNLLIEGTNNQADLNEFIQRYNKITSQNATIDQLFDYDEVLQSWTLTAEALNTYNKSQSTILKNMGMTDNAITQYINDQTQQLITSQIDITSILDESDKQAQKKAATSLRRTIAKYLTLGNKITNELGEMELDAIVQTLYKGGEAGVKVLQQLKGKDNATSDEISAVYNAQMNRLRTAMESIESGAGTILTGMAAEIAKTSEGIETKELPDNSGVVITAVSSMVDVYSNIYKQMSATAEKTTAELNSTFAKLLTAKDQGNIDAISALGDAMGMNYETLGNLLAQYGKGDAASLEKAMSRSGQVNMGLEALGNGTVRITDWQKFSNNMNWEVSGEAYMEAYKAYNDSLIELDRKVGKQIYEEISSLTDAQTGDRINVTYLVEAIKGGEAAVNAALLGMGATVKDGILTIENSAQLGNIISTLANLAKSSGNLITSELAELADAVSEFIDNIVNLIKNGISGGLSNKEASSLKEWAQTYANIEDLDFTRTAEGLQLSEQSAIALYAALKKVDAVKASLVFDELNNSLKTSNENFSSVTAIMGHIKNISDGIYAADGKTSNARLAQYQAELSVAKEILAVRSTQEDDSFNFMSKPIPAAQNNPLNYAKNLAQAFQTFRDAFDTTKVSKNGQTGFMDYEAWYRIVSEFNNMAAISGNEIKLGSLTLKGDLESASNAIQAGASALTTVDTGELKVNLTDVGIGIQSGADALGAGVDKGIKAVAEAQVSALDGLIAMLELIVAMEQLGDIDVDKNGIDLSDLFAVTYDSEGNVTGHDYTKFSEDYKKWVADLKDKINKDSKNYNKDLANAVEGIKIDGIEFKNLLDWTPAQFMDSANKSVAQAYAAMLDAFNKAALSGNYDLDNIQQSVLQVLAESGFDDTVTLDIGDMTYVISAGTMTTIDWTDTDTKSIISKLAKEKGIKDKAAREELTKWIQAYGKGELKGQTELLYVLELKKKIEMENGKATSVTVGGKTYNVKNSTQPERDAAVNAAVLEDFGFDVSNWKIIDKKTGKVEVETKIGDKTIKVHSEEGKVRLISPDGKREYKNQAAFLKGEWKFWLKDNKLKQGDADYKSQEEWQWEEYHIPTKITPKFTYEVDEETKETDPSTDSNLRAKLTDIIAGGRKSIQDLIDKKIDHGDGTYTVDLGDGYTFTFTGGTDPATALEKAIGEQLGIDVALSNTISTAIANAFASDSVQSSVSEAISKGMQNAVKGSGSETTEVPLPSITLVPTEIIVDTSSLNTDTSLESLALPLNDLKAVITNYEDAGANTSTLLINALTGVIKAYEENPGIDKTTLLTGLLGTITSYDDSQASKEALASALVATIKEYKDDGSNKDSLLEALTAIISVYKDNESNKGTLLNALEAVIKFYDDSGSNKSTLLNLLTAVINVYKDDGSNKASLLDALTAYITEYNDEGATKPTLEDLVQFINEINTSGADAALAAWRAQQESQAITIPVTSGQNSPSWEEEEAAGAVIRQFEQEAYEAIASTGTYDLSQLSPERAAQIGQAYATVRLPEYDKYIDPNAFVNRTPQAAEMLAWDLSIRNDFITPKNITGVNIPVTGEVEELDTSEVENEKVSLEGEVTNTNTDTNTNTTQPSSTPEAVDTSGLDSAADALAAAGASAETAGAAAETFSSGAQAAGESATEAASNENTLADSQSTVSTNAASASANLATLSGQESSMGSSASSAAGKVSSLGGAMRSIPGSSTHSVRLNISASVTSTSGKGTVSLSSLSPSSLTALSFAKGNKALAGGQSTLMGELGPELVVSNGHYFVVGQNGAEFVDLAPDAIVFNHKQTASLLNNGKSGRGKPITNENQAISWAKGNLNGGPAAASASAALAALKQLRAEWQSLANLSVADLAKKGGGGGGGGGNKEMAGFIRDIERWYNWLQKIADLEKEINYQEQLRSKLQSDMNSNGKAYYASQKKSYEDMKQSAITSQSLYLSQKDYFEQRREELNNNSPLSELYTFDETGQLHYKEGSYQWLANLFKTDKYGNQKLSPKQQYQEIISRNSNFAQYMKYDDSGKEIKKKDYKTDDEYYDAMVKAFSDRMDSEQEEMQNLFDSWHEQQQAVIEQQQAMNELLQSMKDNQKEVEEAVLNAIVELREREIEELQNTRDAIEQTNKDFINGLNQALDKERQMYQDNQNDQELQRNRRQLAILQRSGTSATQIAQLQQKIDQQAQTQYFDKQQEQIEAVQQASDLQLERLDKQIELAQEQLEYEQMHGLLWGQVYEIMKQNPTDIANFIKTNTKSYWGESPLSSTETSSDWLFKANQWTEFRKDNNMQQAAMGQISQDFDILIGALEQIYGKNANWKDIKATAEKKYDTILSGKNYDSEAAAWDAYKAAGAKAAKEVKKEKEEKKSSSGSSSSSGISIKGRDDKETTWSYNATYHYHKQWNGNGQWGMADQKKHTFDKNGKCTVCGYTKPASKEEAQTNSNSNTGGSKSNQGTEARDSSKGINTTFTDAVGNIGAKAANNITSAVSAVTKNVASAVSSAISKVGAFFGFDYGGVDDFTGLAMLHGTPAKPEGILNAEDYKAWKQDIKTTNLLYNALASVQSNQQNASATENMINNNNSGISIENAVVNMNATIANDYDARRAGEQALEQMLTIARKSGTRSAQRR